jgi:hypothetical protein
MAAMAQNVVILLNQDYSNRRAEESILRHPAAKT